MKSTKQRKAEIQDHKFRTQFHSAERVAFMRNQPCAVTGWTGYPSGNDNAHTAGGGMGLRASYKTIVPLHRIVHTDFDTMSEAKFRTQYQRTKQSVKDMAPHYHQLWLDSV